MHWFQKALDILPYDNDLRDDCHAIGEKIRTDTLISASGGSTKKAAQEAKKRGEGAQVLETKGALQERSGGAEGAGDGRANGEEPAAVQSEGDRDPGADSEPALEKKKSVRFEDDDL